MHLPPFDKKIPFFRGNLHGHSTHSDGELSPERVAATYRDLGYDFICLSDHLWSDKRYSAPTVLDASFLNDQDFITIPSAELHCHGKLYDQDNLWHIVANGLPLDFTHATATETAPEMVQRAIDAGAYVTIAHPEWCCMTSEEALSVSHAHSVEIYNHSCAIGSMRGSGVTVADLLLNNGKRPSFTAADDSHFHTPDAGGGWVMVAAERLEAGALVTALKAGDHYSSSGPILHDISLNGSQLDVKCSASHSVSLVGPGHLAQSRHGPNITSTQFDLSDVSSEWFRVTVRDSAGRHAWSNPYWRDVLQA